LKEKSNYYINKLEENYGNPRTALKYKNHFQLLIAVILSAQTTDNQVNKITPGLFEKFPSPEKLAQAQQDEVQELIKGIGLYRNKSRAIIGCAQKLLESYDGKIPDSREKLMSLPGLGRKSANVVLAVAFNKPAFPVDTHVLRVSKRLGLTRGKTPDQVEKDLTSLIPEEKWIKFHHLLISHGRQICLARHPRCSKCPVQTVCPSNREKTDAG